MALKALVLVMLVLAAPTALARDPLREPTCVGPEGALCVGPSTCTDVGCVPPACQPAAQCYSDVSGAESCAINLTIDGQTCQSVVAASVSHRGAGAVGPTRASGAATLTGGNVNRFNLVNSWVTPGAETDLMVAGVGIGQLSAGVYRSEIHTDGQRGGVLGMVEPSHHQTWTQIALVARFSPSSGGHEDLQVAVWFLDYMPNGCHMRSPSGSSPEVECPRLHEFLP